MIEASLVWFENGVSPDFCCNEPISCPLFVALLRLFAVVMEGTCAEELLWFETEGIGGRFMLLELDLSRLYTFEIDEVDAFT